MVFENEGDDPGSHHGGKDRIRALEKRVQFYTGFFSLLAVFAAICVFIALMLVTGDNIALRKETVRIAAIVDAHQKAINKTCIDIFMVDYSARNQGQFITDDLKEAAYANASKACAYIIN